MSNTLLYFLMAAISAVGAWQHRSNRLSFLVWLTITSTAVIVGFFDLIGSGGQ